jgi:hypothetical protein
MKKILRWIFGTAASIAFLVGCLCFLSAYLAYEEAGRWFSRVTYNTQCTPSERPGCAKLLLQQPNWPYGVEITDKDLLIAGASTLHNTGSGVLAIGGLSMAAAGVLLASNIFTSTSRDKGNPSSGVCRSKHGDSGVIFRSRLHTLP